MNANCFKHQCTLLKRRHISIQKQGPPLKPQLVRTLSLRLAFFPYQIMIKKEKEVEKSHNYNIWLHMQWYQAFHNAKRDNASISQKKEFHLFFRDQHHLTICTVLQKLSTSSYKNITIVRTFGEKVINCLAICDFLCVVSSLIKALLHRLKDSFKFIERNKRIFTERIGP